MKHAATTALAAIALLGLSGCRTRTLEVHTEPEGALVWLNDEQIGRTPFEVGYVHHGRYEVRIRLEGYVPLVTQQSTTVPLDEQPGIDFVGQTVPGDSRTVWRFKLEPLPELADRPGAEAALIERAKAFRDGQSAPKAPEPQPKGEAGTPTTVAPSATSPSTTAPAPTTAN